VLLYVAWYRFTFKRRGLIPWLDLWQDPAGSSQKAIIAGVATIALAWVLGNPLQEQMPDPSGLILTLIGLLMLLNGIYVKLSIGPLADSE
jgi:ammonia channel protein AmtB